MPIFEYRCDDCSHEFEKIVFHQSSQEMCPKCGSSKTKKLLSSFAVHAAAAPAAPVAEAGPCPCGAAERGMCNAGYNKN